MGTKVPSRNHSMRRSLLGAASILLAGVALLAPASIPSVAAAGCISTSDCLSKMTLAEKAGQMTQVANTFLKSNSDIATYGLGSVLSGGGGDSHRAGGTASQWKAMAHNLQICALRSRLGAPPLYARGPMLGIN